MAFKAVLKTAFPFLSAAASAGGPIGTLAASAVGKVLGIEKAGGLNSDSLEDVIQAAVSKDPEAMLKLKSAEQEFKLQMEKLGFESATRLEEIAASDRASARSREIAIRDRLPGILAVSTTGGFFTLLILLAFHAIPDASKDIINIMIGALGTAWIGIVNYYFGSSSGSAAKSRVIEQMKSNGPSSN